MLTGPPTISVYTLMALSPTAEICVGNIAAHRAYGRSVSAPARGAARRNFFVNALSAAQMSLRTHVHLREVFIYGSMVLAVTAFYHVAPRRTVCRQLVACIRECVQRMALPVPDYVESAGALACSVSSDTVLRAMLVADMRRRWELEDDETVCALLGATIAALEHDGYTVVKALNALTGNTHNGRKALAQVLFSYPSHMPS